MVLAQSGVPLRYGRKLLSAISQNRCDCLNILRALGAMTSLAGAWMSSASEGRRVADALATRSRQRPLSAEPARHLA